MPLAERLHACSPTRGFCATTAPPSDKASAVRVGAGPRLFNVRGAGLSGKAVGGAALCRARALDRLEQRAAPPAAALGGQPIPLFAAGRSRAVSGPGLARARPRACATCRALGNSATARRCCWRKRLSIRACSPAPAIAPRTGSRSGARKASGACAAVPSAISSTVRSSACCSIHCSPTLRPKLSAASAPAQWQAPPPTLKLNRDQWRSLRAFLGQASDPRSRRGLRYPLPTALTLLIAGRLAGCRTLAQLADFGRALNQETLRQIGSRRRPPKRALRSAGHQQLALHSQAGGQRPGGGPDGALGGRARA